ncbi:hypothetical protein T07_4581 [Trichinella nelsoni]|uniref:Uncharacterized protein n=1 Tax=Trichinella nelsoni TaxID=6336 RepID=A0A0V0SAP8_9BILA|nr:hypothetical protein T07_4581 [Trichinella nelsoni]
MRYLLIVRRAFIEEDQRRSVWIFRRFLYLKKNWKIRSVEETMRSPIQMVFLAAYAIRHGSTVCCMAHDPCFCPSRLTAVEEQASGTPRVWAVLKRHLRVTCLTKEQWELNYDHDVCVADSPCLYTSGSQPGGRALLGERGKAKFLPTFLPGYLSSYIGSIHINVPL